MIKDKIKDILFDLPETPNGRDLADATDKIVDLIVDTYGPPF